MTPSMHMALGHLHKESYKPEFQRFLARPIVQQKYALINKHLDSWEMSRKSQNDANKK